MALRPQTEIHLSAPDGLSSKALRLGESFTLRVARDVFVGANLVIPRGTPAHGRVTYRTGQGAFGKSAKIEFDLTDIVLDGLVVPIEGHHRLEGRGNTWATVGVAFFVCIPVRPS